MRATMDIGGWLRSLGLGEYKAIFRENKIDETVLPKLTADGLKDLGTARLVIATPGLTEG
jgi:SAM domain (Sterile alpha motif)